MSRDATTLKVGTRGSTLALKQVDIVEEALKAANPGVELERVIVRTEGDRRRDVSLEQLGGQGVFVKEIEARLLSGEFDIAVHSLKDMPAVSPPELTIGAVLPRADVRDVLVSRNNLTLEQLPSGARIGTDSRRRAVQLLAMRPDIGIESIRGNVDTRIRKVAEGAYDAVVLAAAGLERLGLLQQASQLFEPLEMVPAVGQGVLAVQCRADDEATLQLLAAIDDPVTHACIEHERTFLAVLGAGCRLPVACYASVDALGFRVVGLIAGEDGRVCRSEMLGEISDLSIPRTLALDLALEAGVPLAETEL